MKKLMIVMCLCCAVALGAVVQTHAATAPLVDSSQMNLSAINAVQGSTAVSVGTVIIWGAAADPYDAEKWLECNGQNVDRAVYSELFALVGPKLPDYRNQFMRGGTTAQVGQTVADTMRSHAHKMDQHQHTVSGSAGAQTYQAPAAGGGSTAFVGKPEYVCIDWSNTGGDTWCRNYGYVGMYVNTSSGASVSSMTSGGPISGFTNTAGPTSTYATGGAETAPQHIRVRYLIRALP